MAFAKRFVCVAIAAAAMGASGARAENWPQWRGPTGDGVCSEKGLPIRWSQSEGLAWKSPIKGEGQSTPVIWEGRIFLTSQTGKGPEGQGPKFDGTKEGAVPNSEKFGVKYYVHCFDSGDGKLLWQHEVSTDELIPVSPRHNHASPSCVTDGERVYAWFGTGQLRCYQMDGTPVWERELSKDYGPFVVIWGHGSSPILYKDSLILLCEHETGAYLLAVDKRTGKNMWKADRGTNVRSYSTPLLVNADGRDEMIVNTQNQVEGVNPANGEIYWSAKGPSIAVVPMPVARQGVVFASGGFYNAPMLAVRAGGEGAVDDTRVVWKKKNGAAYTSSFICAGDALFMTDDRGFLSCFDVGTGDRLWKERLDGQFSASPVLADGNLYAMNEDGECFVIEASRQFKVVSRNPVEEYTLASVAVSNGRIFFRTGKSLYCVGKAK